VAVERAGRQGQHSGIAVAAAEAGIVAGAVAGTVAGEGVDVVAAVVDVVVVADYHQICC